eukprot:5150396-Pyramimonas_sp.AAC.1
MQNSQRARAARVRLPAYERAVRHCRQQGDRLIELSGGRRTRRRFYCGKRVQNSPRAHPPVYAWGVLYCPQPEGRLVIPKTDLNFSVEL